MFTDEVLDAIELKSSWKKERSVEENGTQTKDLEVSEVAVQAIKRKNKDIQTEGDEKTLEVQDDNSPELLAFLKRLEPLVAEELKANARSHAFDDYSVQWEDETDSVTVAHTLCHSAFQEQLQVTSLSWNSTGSVIAAALGRHDHEDWCTHKSSLCTWNLDRRKLDTEKPDSVVDMACCLMCIQCHPQKPSLIAGGTFNGEVLVWDLSKEEDPVIATSGIGDDSHREPVSKVQWIPDPSSRHSRYQIVSCSSDGKILIWSMSSKKTQLKLADGFILLTESLPKTMSTKARRGDKEMGVTCMSFNHEDSTSFLVGSETGGLFRCSTRTKGTPANREIISSVPLHSPVTFTFESHHGPVYSVESSPYHRNLFLSCGTDASARIYSLLQGQPIVTIEPGLGYLYSAKWSPVRPQVFALATEDGSLLIYDLKKAHGVPELKLEGSPKGKPVYTMQFNPHQKLLATGDGAGFIRIWKLSDDLTQQGSHETEALDELASSVLE